jgi:hypothetical protein
VRDEGESEIWIYADEVVGSRVKRYPGLWSIPFWRCLGYPRTCSDWVLTGVSAAYHLFFVDLIGESGARMLFGDDGHLHISGVEPENRHLDVRVVQLEMVTRLAGHDSV